MNARLGAATQTLAGAAVMITAVTIASRLLGFGRWFTQAWQVGRGGVADAYAAANLLPNVLFEVAAGGALAGAVIPLLVAPLARKAGAEVSAVASAFLTWALGVLVPIGVLLAVFSGPLARLLVSIGDGGDVRVTQYFLAVFAIQVPLYGVSVVLAGVLQAHRRFFWPAAAPMLSSVVVIVAYLVFGQLAAGQQGNPDQLSSAALAWLAWGTTAGVAAMSLPLLVPVLRLGVRFRPTFSFPGGSASRARNLAFAGLGALVAQQFSVLAVMVAARRYGGDGAFNIYQYAQAVYVLPYAILAVPLATSAFPRLAARAGEDDRSGFARLTAWTTRAVLTVSALGAAALVAGAGAVEAVFDSFTPGGADGMAVSIAWSAPGLVGFALIFALSRTLYSIDRGRAAVIAAAAGWSVVVLVALVLPPLVVDGRADIGATLASLGMANSLGMAVAGALLLWALHRHAGTGALVGLGRTGVVLAIGGAVAAWAGRATAEALLPDDPWWLVSVGVGLLAAAVAGVVVAGAVFLGDRSVLRDLEARRSRG
ncbi:lipid II flippase MurJ [Sanguibacter sp. 26GB23]|uniref:murein biosynthesis integral membrane protein MurJ n=1 Tax=Sanguibacter sp. 26GB23 TaxID=3156066 RepID=UPI0032AF274F